MKRAGSPHARGAGDEAVEKRTGKTWPEWFKVLDGEGASKMTHTGIAALLHGRLKCTGWWSQMIAVEYERARGLRAVHQKGDGDFSAGLSRTMAASPAAVFRAWTDRKTRGRWLPGAPLEITRATPGKSVRIRWDGGLTRVDVNLWKKGERKSLVQLEHEKLKSEREVLKAKAFWAKALERLRGLVEAGG